MNRFFRWLLRENRKLDPVLERKLKKNREALERQRQESADLSSTPNDIKVI
jgi:hypothetical protein